MYVSPPTASVLLSHPMGTPSGICSMILKIRFLFDFSLCSRSTKSSTVNPSFFGCEMGLLGFVVCWIDEQQIIY